MPESTFMHKNKSQQILIILDRIQVDLGEGWRSEFGGNGLESVGQHKNESK